MCSPFHPVTVHPRASGEHCCSSPGIFCIAGSSPRERGTPFDHWTRNVVRRFIPARAGNTRATVTLPVPVAVHPRASGEHRLCFCTSRATTGSSPRERGTRRDRPQPCRHRRFIPARAGNTGEAMRAMAGPSVHPRASGEHNEILNGAARRTGSSPRERGTQGWQDKRWHLVRFIPARAGNTTGNSGTHSPPPVHPRASGEH